MSDNLKTIGEIRVRTSFNPSANSKVDQIKQKTAELINLLEELRLIAEQDTNGKDIAYPADKETQRLISLAQTSYEEAAMWAVKAVTA